MSWEKRLGYSVISVLIADLCSAVVYSLYASVTGVEKLHSVGWMLIVTIYFVLAGWLLSLPLVLGVRRVSKGSLLLLGVGGTAIGPVITALWAMGNHWNWVGPVYFGYAVQTSIVATGIYLGLFIKWAAGTNSGAAVSQP